MGKYVYASCVGNVYLMDEPQDLGPCEMCGDYDEYIGYGDTKEEIAELLYRDSYTSGAIYDVTGMVPDFKLRKPTEEELRELHKDGHRYYGEFD